MKSLIWFLFLPLFSFSQDITGNLDLYLEELIDNIPEKDGDDFVLADDQELLHWATMLQHLLVGNVDLASDAAANINYELNSFLDSTNNHTYLLIQESIPQQHFWGTLVYNNTACRPIVLQAPHPKHDSNTGVQSVFCFKRLNALALLINGTHRCNSLSLSSCDGVSSACDSPAQEYRLSDPAHHLDNIFQTTTSVLADLKPESIFIQLHGFSKADTDPYLIISNGIADLPQSVDYALLIGDALVDIDPVLNYKIPHIEPSWTRLIGTTNVQGRLLNQGPENCNQAGSLNSGRFLHIEQERNRLRADSIGWTKMYLGLAEVFGCTPASSTSQANISKVKIYPNPSNQLLTISGLEELNQAKISVINLEGQTIMLTITNAKQSVLDISQLHPGLYLLKITSDQHNSSYPIIKN